jgi:aspartyl-tRNA(Asn)/glutamyl-tRNA(Gln) amidotransferase subunit A
MKPTLGLVSNRGQFGDGNVSFSVPGPLARSVRDAALAAQALAGFDAEYAYSRPSPPPDLLADLDAGIAGIRVGTSADLLVPPPDAAVAAAYDATLARLAGLGAQVTDVAMPHHDRLAGVAAAVFAIEGGTQMRDLIGERPRLFSPQTAPLVLDQAADPTVWARTARDRQWIARDYDDAFTRVDVLCTPTVPLPAPRIDDDERTHVFRVLPYTAAVNMVGLPAISIPMGMADGLPLGVQVIGPRGGDAVVLRVARALEQADAAHRVARPPLDRALTP